MLLTVGRTYVGNDVTYSTLLDRAGPFPYENLPECRSQASKFVKIHGSKLLLLSLRAGSKTIYVVAN